jgi:methylmalonyl-CoA mutase cobalamin-binding subunit
MKEYKDIQISTYVINLKERTERLVHIQDQFSNRAEFNVQVIDACKNKIGAIGLWQSIIKVIKLAVDNDDDVIIIAEDDHEFTEFYNQNYLISNIIEAHNQGVAILSGGIAGFGNVVPLTENRFWVDSFLSTQFIVVYKKIYQDILAYKFKKKDVADLVLSNLTSHKMILYPFISVQKDFGYSDITTVHNEIPGLVSNMFNSTNLRLEKIQNICGRYVNHKTNVEKISIL